jgi:hypothetical protein
MKKVIVIGNGSGEIPNCNGKTVICFNGFDTSVLKAYKKITRIENGHQFGQSKNFKVTPLNQKISHSLKATALNIEKQINAWPSSGLTCLSTLKQLGCSIEFCKMQFQPSLLRSAEQDANVPLAACFHNWLAEYRLAHTLFNKSSHNGAEETKYEVLNFKDPFTLLLSGELALNDLEKLGTTEYSIWYEYSTLSKIKAVEHLFYIKRNELRSTNWWFFDLYGSIAIDQIFKILMDCQKKLLCS